MKLPARSLCPALLFVACAPLGPVDPPDPRTVVFRCEQAGPVTVTFTPRRARLVQADGRVVELDQQPSGSGFRYQGSQGELRGKGDEITWTSAAAPPRTCAAARVEATGTASG